MFYAQSTITVISVTFVQVYSLVYTISLHFLNQPDSKLTEKLLGVHFLLLFYQQDPPCIFAWVQILQKPVYIGACGWPISFTLPVTHFASKDYVLCGLHSIW